MREFVAEFALDEVLHIVDDDGTIWGRFGVAYQPAWVFIAPDGTIEVVAGAIPDGELESRLTAIARP
jgi:hypothetical protein